MLDAFFMYELQEAELESLGMVDPEGNWQIEREDLQALLAGRRTKLLRLQNLNTDGFQIVELESIAPLPENRWDR